MLILTGDEVREALSMSEAIDVNANAFKQLYEKQADIPQRTFIHTSHGVTGFMPGHLKGTPAIGAKIVSVRPENPKRGLPSVPAQVILYDPVTAEPLVLMDGTYLTWLRTAAGSGAATKFLAKNDVKKVAVFGAGKQAEFHIEAVVAARPGVKQVVIVNRSVQNGQKLADKLKKDKKYAGIEFTATQDSKSALKGADVVVTATGSNTPVFDGKDLEPGTHLNCIGGHAPKTQEVDEETVVRSKVVLDVRAAAMAEAGEIIVPLNKGLIKESHVLAELGEVAAGKKVRTSDKDITLFKSVGNAVQDIATALAVYEKAKKLGLGKEVNLTAKL